MLLIICVVWFAVMMMDTGAMTTAMAVTMAMMILAEMTEAGECPQVAQWGTIPKLPILRFHLKANESFFKSRCISNTYCHVK